MQTHKGSNNVVENNVSIVGNGAGPTISNLQHETCLPSTSNDDIRSVPRMSNLQHAPSSTSSSDMIPALDNSGTLVYMAPSTDLTNSSEDVKSKTFKTKLVQYCKNNIFYCNCMMVRLGIHLKSTHCHRRFSLYSMCWLYAW